MTSGRADLPLELVVRAQQRLVLLLQLRVEEPAGYGGWVGVAHSGWALQAAHTQATAVARPSARTLQPRCWVARWPEGLPPAVGVCA